ncbi:CBS domain-containing protein [Bradyrhizobium sp.]|uniref:CBS domain-containing protein n=1 Tax=Bradyrhizobium sp. TaxID=376 RepID=UPI0034341A93
MVYCRPDSLLHEIWMVMKKRHLQNVPILDRESWPIGVLNARDALEALVSEPEYEERMLVTHC